MQQETDFPKPSLFYLKTTPSLMHVMQMEQPLCIMHHASANGHVNCIEVLLNNHADIQKRDKFGKNCLDLAVERIEIDACMAIVKHKRLVGFMFQLVLVKVTEVYFSKHF